uniref:Exosome complex exonuclease RRP44-like n=1 Tax=Petromyzon marinus TaxID=7757 RepID=A0AAJ7SKI2_PETMA
LKAESGKHASAHWQSGRHHQAELEAAVRHAHAQPNQGGHPPPVHARGPPHATSAGGDKTSSVPAGPPHRGGHRWLLRHSCYPNGHFVRSLGECGDKETETEVLLLEHDVPHQPFSQAVLACLPPPTFSITAEDQAGREDLRALSICSVDPPGCTDIDDALHCKPLDNGNTEVGVHIADVSYFIRPGNALDEEASLRGTTVYLCEKRIDMVPELLSSNLCSLRSNVDRLAFSCIWEMTPKAEIVSTRFYQEHHQFQ